MIESMAGDRNRGVCTSLACALCPEPLYSAFLLRLLLVLKLECALGEAIIIPFESRVACLLRASHQTTHWIDFGSVREHFKTEGKYPKRMLGSHKVLVSGDIVEFDGLPRLDELF